MKIKNFLLTVILGISLAFAFSSCSTGDEFDAYIPDNCQDCGNNGNNNGNGDDNGDDDTSTDPVEGADLTLKLNLSSFESVYGQVESNGDEYLNFYGNGRSIHLNFSTLEVEKEGANIISIATAYAEAEKYKFEDISENLYYDHTQKIWLWVYNKESQSFMIEMGKNSWTMSPSAKDRFFDYDYEIKEEGTQLWIDKGDDKICFVINPDL